MDTAKARSTITRAAREADEEEGLRLAARIGLIARGVVYVIFGIIAFNLARGDSSSGDPSTKGALGELAGKSYGAVLLVLLGVGLALYALACAVAAVRGHGGKKPGESDTTDRLADAGRAVVNGSLSAVAFKVLADGRREAGSGSKTEKQFTARVLDWPGGPLIVGAAALAVVGWGLWQLKKAYTASFVKGLHFGSISERARRIVIGLGRAGYAARGVVFVLVGWFLIHAALDHQPDDAVGIDGALRRLIDASYGPFALALVGLGVIAFGLWSVAEGWFRRPE